MRVCIAHIGALAGERAARAFRALRVADFPPVANKVYMEGIDPFLG